MTHRAPLAVASMLLLAACSSPQPASTTTAPVTPTAPATATTAPTTSAPTDTATPGTSTPGTSTSAATPATPGGAASGRDLAASMRAASTGVYTVKSVVTGDQPATITGRGSLTDRSLAVHLDGDADTAQDVEVVAGTAYTSLAGYTKGRQRVLVDLADQGDQLADLVRPIVGAADLDRVLTALAGATRVTRSGDVVTASVPGRSLVTLFGWGYDGSVPASGPLTITLDAQGRPVRVVAQLHAATRTSTYGGYTPGDAITAPAKADLVDSPL